MSSKLTPKQEKFAQLVVELGNQAEAYRKAYNSKAKPDSVYVRASKLMREDKIALRVDQLREQLEKKNLWRREDSVRVLSMIANGKDPEGKTGDRVNAVKALNAMHGFDAPIKVDNTHKIVDDGENEW